ncbi:hypothetical protein GOBAR_DD11703 [Gossypium barbadense]|nr:hypothetical protein GOBAR_DD11703 [Gossypium barbadense]
MLGLAADRLRADMNRLLSFLFHQGILDEQFLQLQQLQDETSPNFVSEVVNIYFHESEKLLRNLRSLLMDREFSDYNKMGIHLNQFMGSSSSIGAKRIRNVCLAFRAASDQNNRAGCLSALEVLEHEYCFLKNKLHELFQDNIGVLTDDLRKVVGRVQSGLYGKVPDGHKDGPVEHDLRSTKFLGDPTEGKELPGQSIVTGDPLSTVCNCHGSKFDVPRLWLPDGV